MRPTINQHESAKLQLCLVKTELTVTVTDKVPASVVAAAVAVDPSSQSHHHRLRRDSLTS